jgi:transposase
MINMPQGTLVHLCCRPTDMRKSFDGLAAEVHDVFRANPYCGQVFVFRNKRGNLVKILYWDGTGLCQLFKRLEKGQFAWPPMLNGGFQMSMSQLSMLLEGMDWRRTLQIEAPRIPAYA